MNKVTSLALVIVAVLGLFVLGYAQSDDQGVVGVSTHTRMEAGGGLAFAWGSTWVLARLSIVRGQWGVDLDLWSQGLETLLLLPTMRVDFDLQPNRFRVGFAPVVLFERGRPKMLEFLLVKGGIIASGYPGLEAFTEILFPFRLSFFPVGFLVGVGWMF